MTKVIWKTTLKFGLVEYNLPKGAKILSAALQGDHIMAWFLCSPEEQEREPRKLLLTGTGHQFDEAAYRFVGTVLTDGGTFVWHVFEVVSPAKAMAASLFGQEVMP